MSLKQGIVDKSPIWLTQWINKILYHPGTPWFFLGMGIEALGLSIQFFFQGSSYPIFDAIIAFILGYTILYYHNKENAVAE
jgi:hypothetical protein